MDNKANGRNSDNQIQTHTESDLRNTSLDAQQTLLRAVVHTDRLVAIVKVYLLFRTESLKQAFRQCIPVSDSSGRTNN